MPCHPGKAIARRVSYKELQVKLGLLMSDKPQATVFRIETSVRWGSQAIGIQALCSDRSDVAIHENWIILDISFSAHFSTF